MKRAPSWYAGVSIGVCWVCLMVAFGFFTWGGAAKDKPNHRQPHTLPVTVTTKPHIATDVASVRPRRRGFQWALNVSQHTFAGRWPLGVGDADLACDPETSAETVTAAGAEYALNGTAIDHGYPELPETIWLVDRDHLPARISTDDFTTAAAKLCDQGKLDIDWNDRSIISDPECLMSLRCTGERFVGATAHLSCKEHIEHLTRWQFEWTDSLLSPAFSRLSWSDPKPHIVMTGDELKLQNGFGAWRKVTYHCIIEPQTGTVFDASIDE